MLRRKKGLGGEYETGTEEGLAKRMSSAEKMAQQREGACWRDKEIGDEEGLGNGSWVSAMKIIGRCNSLATKATGQSKRACQEIVTRQRKG